jgi:hypothetical protein
MLRDPSISGTATASSISQRVIYGDLLVRASGLSPRTCHGSLIGIVSIVPVVLLTEWGIRRIRRRCQSNKTDWKA